MVMESDSKLHSQNIQTAHDFDWPYHEDIFQTHKGLELPNLDDGYFDFNSFSFPYHFDYLSQFEFPILGNFSGEIFSPDEHIPPLYDEKVIDEKPQQHKFYGDEKNINVKTEMEEVIELRGFSNWKSDENELDEKKLNYVRRKSTALELEEIQKYFNVPISEAARELKVGLTVLKKRCRELNIMRWPHRKLKSLKSLINNVKEMGLTNEMIVLEEHKRLVEILPDMELTERTKRLRQACFKASYKKRRSMAALRNF